MLMRPLRVAWGEGMEAKTLPHKDNKQVDPFPPPVSFLPLPVLQREPRTQSHLPSRPQNSPSKQPSKRRRVSLSVSALPDPLSRGQQLGVEVMGKETGAMPPQTPTPTLHQRKTGRERRRRARRKRRRVDRRARRETERRKKRERGKRETRRRKKTVPARTVRVRTREAPREARNVERRALVRTWKGKTQTAEQMETPHHRS
mmetsp:Transcript_30132/g.59157  ORF Transcript_30132/g.59157 Transcript_30132/m.59157 type:complete len:202 (+) Transcript_30132:124-729(+)